MAPIMTRSAFTFVANELARNFDIKNFEIINFFFFFLKIFNL